MYDRKKIRSAQNVTDVSFFVVKAIAIKLNGQYAKLTDESCPSHHSPNDVIPFIK